ncbi:hypothetical protein EDD18DRAFT_1144484 [Armillaria luteobubalina]|uniref:Uncharacterized protein n=1 Tax=Armillaria luteobubalina TaxID=153913 RepID=A0AA39QH90_9AGAR|nr:hypothetical protein EDD18DRAFT_1144484 [Armillaria luteobubalina]
MILRIPPALRGTSLSLGRLMTFRRTFARIATSLRPCPDISTLNAVNLSRDDFCDFSNMVTVGAVGDPSPQRFTYQRVGNHYIPFPRSCKGFLYYWTHTDLPAIFGGIRFRLLPGGESSLFSTGKDLCMPNGIPWSVPLGQAVGRNGKMLQLLLKDGLVDQCLINSEYIQAFVKLRLKTGSVLLQSFEEPFVLSLPQDSVRVHLLSKGRPPEKVFLAFKPMPEIQNLVEGGQKVHAHARLEVSQPKSNSLRVRLRILRVFVQGVPLDSEFSPVECRSMTGLSAFLSWLPSTYELPQSFYGEKCNNDG